MQPMVSKANLSAFHSNAFTADAADGFLNDGDTIEVGRFQFRVLHTPGHSPGGISLVTDGVVFTGDALFWGLPDNTVVYSGHGPKTTIGHEKSVNPFLI